VTGFGSQPCGPSAMSTSPRSSSYDHLTKVIGDVENIKFSLQSGLEHITTRMIDEVFTNSATEAGSAC